MPRYPDAKGFDHAATEQETLRWWDEHGVFEQSLKLREDPPTANGAAGSLAGHSLYGLGSSSITPKSLLSPANIGSLKVL